MPVKKQERPVTNMGAELIDALNQISRDKGIEREIIFETIEASLVSACKKNYGANANILASMDRKTGEITVINRKEIVRTVTDETCEIQTKEAKKIDPGAEVGGSVDFVVTPADFGRIAAMAAKQFVVQKFREVERNLLYDEFSSKEREVATGIVSRKDKRNYIIALGKLDAVLLPSEQIPNEELIPQSRVKVFITEVRQTSKGPSISVSRTHPELVKKLFEQEVPEVHDGIIEIRNIAREAGHRTKIAVISSREDIDPVGACVGPKGSRVNIIVDELKGEKIDIIPYNEDAAAFITSALSPSKPVVVVLNDEDRTARVVVPDHQLSLAIGREGQNVRLAAKLTGWRIDIKSVAIARETGFVDASLLDGADEHINGGFGHTGGDYDYDEDYDDYDDDDYYDEEEYEEQLAEASLEEDVAEEAAVEEESL